MVAGLGWLGGPVDADDPALALQLREAGDHARLRAAGHRAHDDRVEIDAQLALLVGHLERPVGEPEAAERVVGRARGDRVRRAAALGDVGERLLPALLEADPELRAHEADVGAHDAAELDVADAVVDDVGPVDPALLHDDASEPEPRSDRGDLAGVVGLHAPDRDQRVAALRQRFGHEELELARLVAAVREAAVAVLALGPQRRTAEVAGQPIQPMHRRRAEQERVARERLQVHGACGKVPSTRRRSFGHKCEHTSARGARHRFRSAVASGDQPRCGEQTDQR